MLPMWHKINLIVLISYVLVDSCNSTMTHIQPDGILLNQYSLLVIGLAVSLTDSDAFYISLTEDGQVTEYVNSLQEGPLIDEEC